MTDDYIVTEDGYRIEIGVEICPPNPHAEYDTLSVLTELSSDYRQPSDAYDQRIIDAWECGRYWKTSGACAHDTELVERYAREFLDAAAVAWWGDPRGGSRIFGYITREACEREGVTDPEGCLKAELGEYAAWVQDEVYYWAVYDPDGSILASVGGYYGEWGYDAAREDATETVSAERAARLDDAVSMFRRMVDSSNHSVIV